jgi:hypothetical protein
MLCSCVYTDLSFIQCYDAVCRLRWPILFGFWVFTMDLDRILFQRHGSHRRFHNGGQAITAYKRTHTH